ncbi:hypothetical protein SLA2020_437970 [Shorea laevis]
MKSNKRPKLKMPTTLPNPPPDLPEEFKNRIEAMGGTQVEMVIQKALYQTDLQKNNSRLSMPFSQINKNFLREAEREHLAQQNIMTVQFMEPSRKVNEMILRQWDMPKKSGKTSSIYVLRTKWNHAFRQNGLVAEDVVQVWSFRVGIEQNLCMALVVVSRSCRKEDASTSQRGEEGVGAHGDH